MTTRERELQLEGPRNIPAGSSPAEHIDFYLRKIQRLQTENFSVLDQLSKLKVKLRRTEDYQSKQEALLTEITTLKKDKEVQGKTIFGLQSEIQSLKLKLDERGEKGDSWGSEKRMFKEQIQKWKEKAETVETRRIADLVQEKAKSADAIKKERETLLRSFEEKEEETNFELRQLKKALSEKETVEAVVMNRVQKIRKEKDEEIRRLSEVIEDQKKRQKQAIESKNEEIDMLKSKFERMINFEVQNLKKNLDDQDELFGIELNGLREIIGIKNQEITRLHKEVKILASSHMQERQELLKEISMLKERMYVRQREAELELNNLIERLTKLHSVDLQDIATRNSQIVQSLRKDKTDVERYSKEKDKLREGEMKETKRIIAEMEDRVKEKDDRINELLERMKEAGNVNTSQLKDLHASFHKIQGEKETLSAEYQENITFMTQQIAKLTASNQVKNAELKKLYEELQETKLRFDEELKNAEDRLKAQRKERDGQREREMHDRDRQSEQLGNMQRDYKINERRLQREKEKEERQKNKLKFIVEQLQRDIERLNKYIKQLDQNLKKEYKQNQLGILDETGSRRELNSQINQQRIQIQTLKNNQIDQIKRKMEMTVNSLATENSKLKTDLLNKSIALENMENEFKKLEHFNKNADRIQKEKLLDYQKKMATLNSEIFLTQTLYKKFLEKGKLAKEPLQ